MSSKLKGGLKICLLACGLTVTLAGCATAGRIRQQPATTQGSVDRGRFYALRSCAGCHAVGDSGDSPNSHAPVFRRLDERVAASELGHRLGDLSSGGHREMPPIFMSPDEIDDLVAYVGTLERGAPAALPGRGRGI